MSGLLALPARPRSWPARLKSYLANLTWSAIHWGSGGTFWDKKAHRWHWFDQLIVHPNLASGANVTVLPSLCGHDVVEESLSDHLPLEAILAVELSK